VKRLHANDSADTRVKVGNRQAIHFKQKPHPSKVGFLRFYHHHHCLLPDEAIA
jgi:hypothetical protein